jgi:LysR family transcriptional regulator, glycine cleavage system transcriptional activator
MNQTPTRRPVSRARQRPLRLDGLRAFEAVARLRSFSAAGLEMSLTQPAVSRQIKALEEELGAALFARGTRHVEITEAGLNLQQAVLPLLDRLDRCVKDIRQRGARRQVSVSTFASFASLWLLPRLADFQASHADIDIRISAQDRLLDADDPDQDLLLRFGFPGVAPAHAERLFGEVITPVCSPMLLAQSRNGQLPALRKAADLAGHTLLEEDGRQPSSSILSWQHWLMQKALEGLEPRRWVYLNYTHQQVQAALAGQGIALARLALVHEPLARGELVEPFGQRGRIATPTAYWLAPTLGAKLRPELRDAIEWIRSQAALTRLALGEAAA